MKKNDGIILIATALFTILFYKQLLGLNLFVFNVGLLLLLFYRDSALLKHKTFLLAAFLSIVTSFSCYLHQSTFSIVMNMFSLIVTAATAMNQDNSIIVNLFHGIYSQLTVFAYIIYDLIKKRFSDDGQVNHKKGIIKNSVLAILPILITAVFFALYRDSNAVFKMISNQINLDFVSLQWIGFTLLGLILVYPFFLQRNLNYITQKDLLKSDHLTNDFDEEHRDWFQSVMTFKSELLTGTILFVLINILTLSVNITDIIYTWGTFTLPAGVSFSEYIHSGISSLIVSILLAIAIILFYFRGAINFYSSNKVIKALAYVWIVQNVFLVLSTLLRNKIYVDTYSLTEKRVGVFIYLGLSILGLILCFYKIAAKKNNVFLFRKNMWAIYLSLAFLSIIDWSYCISSYNIYRAKKMNNFYLDASYMGALSENNFEVVWKFYRSLPNTDFRKDILKNLLDVKLNAILLKCHQYDFRSASYQRQQLGNFIRSLENKHEIKTLNASGLGLTDLKYLQSLHSLESINLSNNQLKNIDYLETFDSLHTLTLSSNSIDSFKRMPKLPALQELDMSGSSLRTLNPICTYSNLRILDISDNFISNLDRINSFQNLEVLDLSRNLITSYEPLLHLQKLNSLKISGISNSTPHLPNLAALEKLDISNSSFNTNSTNLFIDDLLLSNLKELNISSSNLRTTNALTMLQFNNKLEVLNLSSNNLDQICSLEATHLKSLNLSQNLLGNDSLYLPSTLEILDLSSTGLTQFAFLHHLNQLRSLDLSNDNLFGMDSTTLNRLEQLNVNYCQNVAQLKYISMPNLKELSINQCDLQNQSFLAQLPNLEKIEISTIDKKVGEQLLKMKKLKKIECFSIDEEIYNQLISKNPGIWIIRNDENKYSRGSSTSSF